MPRARPKVARRSLAKAPTGIQGLDEVTGGGLPKGRVTLLCGSAGCGKSLLAMEFLVHGAVRYGEPGVCMDFEETEEKLRANVASLGFDLRELAKRKKLLVDYVAVERHEIAESGEYNLDGLFIRLGHAVKAIKAKRVVLDSIEALFSGLTDSTILRAELRRLFRWLEDHKLTAVVTGEAGEHTLTRHGLEEYIADCVIALDHRVTEQISTRRLRIVKYRGTSHGTDEYPFLIDREGSLGGAAQFAGTYPRSTDGPRFDGNSRFGRDDGREGVFPWKQCAGVGHGGNGKIQPGCELRQRRLRSRRSLPVFRV